MRNAATAVVFGATGGIGLAATERLLEEGIRVIAVGRNLKRTSVLEKAGAVPCRLDITKSDAGARFGKWLRKERLASIDYVVHAAGTAEHASFAKMTAKKLATTLASTLSVNTVAPLALTHALLPFLNRRDASILFLGSTLSNDAAPNTLVYTASKAAIVAAARVLANELAPTTRVNVLSLGLVATPMLANRNLEQLGAIHALERVGTPEEVAETIVHMLKHRWMTGSEVVLDGGLLLHPH